MEASQWTSRRKLERHLEISASLFERFPNAALDTADADIRGCRDLLENKFQSAIDNLNAPRKLARAGSREVGFIDAILDIPSLALGRLQLRRASLRTWLTTSSPLTTFVFEGFSSRDLALEIGNGALKRWKSHERVPSQTKPHPSLSGR
jgi:hypothetical protein